ncbi:NAD(+)/NADH kinase [Papillibacter cinnamivorans]|uniref:NAD kinase n=1 Tax=Papillibacter cinnamivorans DSM 12816 TaxID=1122930 RepID=A0A1W2CJK2_9FIRM|nr:NAD(+)/NADH kinase [Papillibacter cinnamivorans]SMC85415.1 NAD+ kinase [Papillibacter cinnamivorans DSM 12816]
MNPLKKIILCPNPFRDRGLKAALQAAEILGNAGIGTAVCLPFPVNGEAGLPEGVVIQPLPTALRGADLIICFGGDGTILHVAKEAANHRIPVLGVNMGSIGFMAELESGELHLLSKLARGECRREARMMIDIQVLRAGKRVYQNIALNDAVITKGAIARIIELSVFSSGALISSFSGDGVIISTPTGSTAYSMSAGGPIVEPTAENILVTPICAHTLAAKSFVLSQDRAVKTVVGALMHKSAYLSVDGGRAFRLYSSDEVLIRKSDKQTTLVCLSDNSFYEVIKRKFSKQGEPV